MDRSRWRSGATRARGRRHTIDIDLVRDRAGKAGQCGLRVGSDQERGFAEAQALHQRADLAVLELEGFGAKLRIILSAANRLVGGKEGGLDRGESALFSDFLDRVSG